MDKVPLDRADKELLDNRTFEHGAPTMSLRDFIGRLLVDAVGAEQSLRAFYKLVNEHGLVIHDKVIEGKPVSLSDLLASLQKREQQVDGALADSFQFWTTLTQEGKYSVFHDDVAKAYALADKTEFPWLNWNDKFVSLPVQQASEAETVMNEDSHSHIAPKKTSVKNVKKQPRTRKTNLRRAIEAAIEAFKRKPSFDELWQFFLDGKDETGFITDYTDDAITWMDTKGKFHDTGKRAIENCLSRIKL
jgi:hypothetical protein